MYTIGSLNPNVPFRQVSDVPCILLTRSTEATNNPFLLSFILSRLIVPFSKPSGPNPSLGASLF